MPNPFPDIYPGTWDPDWERFQERDTAKSGALQINAYDPTRQFSARGTWSTLTRAQYDQIEDHWFANDTLEFTLFNFRHRKLRDVWVAVADGVSLIYDVPGKLIVSPSVKHNNVVAGSQPALISGTGIDGRDQIQYTSGTKPAAGVVITLSAADGRQAFEVNYGNVRFSDRHREADIWIAEAEFVQKVVG
jgi:hypothetical protein